MAGEAISFTTFNLLNFNAADRRMYRDDDALSADEVEAKVAWTAAMLPRVEADVIGFQELWDPPTLQRALDASGLGPTHGLLAPPEHDGRSIVCAAAVRRELMDGEPEWITEFPKGFRIESQGDDPQTPDLTVGIDAFSRPVLHLSVAPRDDRRPIHVFVCHLKSKRETDVSGERWFRTATRTYKPHAKAIGRAVSTIRRTAEATALRIILTGIMGDTEEPVVVLGDLNDGQSSNVLEILTEQPNLLRPLSFGGGDTALYSVQSLQEMESLRDVYYTYIYQRVHSSLDHILVSRELYGQSRNRVWAFRALDIFNDHLNGEAGEKARGSNDHGIVRARFDYRPSTSRRAVPPVG